MSTATATPATMTARPSITASVLAVLAAVLTLSLLGISIAPVLGLELAGLGLVAGGMALSRRGWSVPGISVAVTGIGGCLAGVALAVTTAGGFSDILWTVPGVLGLPLLGLAVVPIRGSGTRWLVKAGTGGIVLSVGLAGLFRVAPLGSLLLAIAATVVAWDAGEHAIDVGRQLGRSSSTWRLDVSHVGATAVIGGVGVLVGHSVAGIRAGEMSLSSFALFFLALLALTVALHR